MPVFSPILRPSFVDAYRSRGIPWGFPSGPNSLGEATYRRTYERNGEGWAGTLERNVNGCWETVESHCRQHGLKFDRAWAESCAEEMFERAFTFKWTPPGRGLWMGGTDFVRERTAAGLYNCAFVSTKGLGGDDPDLPFCFLMDLSMLGVGVGFDTRGRGSRRWDPWNGTRKRFVIPDRREGWVHSVRLLLRWAFGLGARPDYVYDEVRPANTPIKGFGGKASGPGPLKDLHEALFELALRRRGEYVSSADVVDVMNLEGVCVVAGNVRRTAEIALGDADDEGFLDLKDYGKNPYRAAWGWTSNNTVRSRRGMDYGPPALRTVVAGEPGYFWLENARSHGRMKDPADWRDYRVEGTNPCGEQSLESWELCNLVENYPSHQDSLEDFKRSLYLSFLYAKAVALLPVHWHQSNAVMARNRRVGSSLSGVTDFLADRGEDGLVRWCDEGYEAVGAADRDLSSRWGVPESVKKTSVKPSGTVSLPAGVRPGAHWQTHRFFIRRVRYAASHPDVAAFRAAGYRVEPSANDAYTAVVEFPCAGHPTAPTEEDVPLEGKLNLAVLLQAHWADNQVSMTAAFERGAEGPEIPRLLREYEDKLKAISFLPRDPGVYPQMPYEGITEAEYRDRVQNLRPVVWGRADHHAAEDKYCDGEACEVR